MQSTTTYYAFLATVVLAACSESTGPLTAVDTGVPADAGAAIDAETPPPPADAEPAPTPDAGAAPDATSAPDADAAPDATAPSEDAGPTGIGPTCFADIWDPNAHGPNYDQFMPVIGSHCYGTNHQAIAGVERVVFLGDSVTVGTPPTPSADFYRSQLADRLAMRFNLHAPSATWKLANVLNGMSLAQSSGDFSSCAKWGARTDDLMQDNTQVEDCFPMSERNKRTLVIMTMGGNDIAAITKDGAPSGGHTYAEVEQMTHDFVDRLREAVRWMKDPANIPGGVYIIFSNMYEFTDATGDVASCPAAGAAGFNEPWTNEADLENLVIWANEQYMEIAVETQSDMIMALEHFCGHGYHNDDPNSRCYRGPNTPRWFDLSCIHPNPTGHGVLTDMFMAVVDE